MSDKTKGNLRGLAPSEIRRIERLYSRSVDVNEVVSPALAREISETAHDLGRRIGVLISREGKIEEVVVGTKEILYLPDLGRYRLGKGRLRRLRLIFSDLSKDETIAHIPSDIFTDLEKLRFDAVVAVKAHENRVFAALAHLVPVSSDSVAPIVTEQIPDLFRHPLDFRSFIESIEEQLGAASFSTHRRDRALLVGVYGGTGKNPEDSIAELRELARTAGVEIAGEVIQKRQPDPRTLLGKGKLEEVVLRCLRLEADLLIFDAELKPAQWRVITNSTELKVIDRSMLILDIFAQRASSSDGRLQVELAQLRYNLPRLVEKDLGLSRLTGGIGGRGPGETKLEIGRRRIRDRIADLEKRIDQLGRQRELRRKKRKNIPIPLVAILGYTNAGKSTLFNALTAGEVLQEDKLFATLDPSQGRTVLPAPAESPELYGIPVVITDTVGFIQDLPSELRNAFRATLEELYQATVLLHLVDVSNPRWYDQYQSVEKVLEEMKLTEVETVLVFNKIDSVSEEELRQAQFEVDRPVMAISAAKRIGLDQLKNELSRKVTPLIHAMPPAVPVSAKYQER